MNEANDSQTQTGTHTPGHRDCPECERAICVQSEELCPGLTFREAFRIWIERRVIERAGMWTNVRYVSERTEHDLRQYARAAGKFFNELRLSDIHAGHLREYQKARAFNRLRVAGVGDTEPWGGPAGANLIRKEVQTVVRVLRAAGAWTAHLEECFEPVTATESNVPRAMTPDEQHRWLHVASSRAEWQLVYWWSLVALQTTAATNEMRALRLGDVFLGDAPVLQIRSEGAKNKFRIRTIPLESQEVNWAMRGLLERARRLGACGPHCYLFPFHVTADRYDAARPMSVWGLRKAWDAVRSESGLDWLRVYDLRHAAITRMAEAGVPIQVIMSFAGHMSPRMQQHYTAISMQAKRGWAATVFLRETRGPQRKEPARERRMQQRQSNEPHVRVSGV